MFIIQAVNSNPRKDRFLTMEAVNIAPDDVVAKIADMIVSADGGRTAEFHHVHRATVREELGGEPFDGGRVKLYDTVTGDLFVANIIGI